MANFNLTNFKGSKFFRVNRYLIWGGEEYVGTHVCVLVHMYVYVCENADKYNLVGRQFAVFKTTPPPLNYVFNGSVLITEA